MTNLFKKLIVILVFFCFAVSPHYSAAQECQINPQITLPLAFSKHLPVIPVLINGQTVQMGVDTGNSTTAITAETAARLGSSSVRQRSATVEGAGGTVQTPFVRLDSVDLAGMHFERLGAPVIQLIGQPGVEGLLGANVLSNFDLEFDFPEKTLTFYRLQNCSSFSPPWQGSYQEIPVTLTQSKLILLQVELDGHLLTGLFDTGAYSERLNMASIVNAGPISDFLKPDPMKANTGVAGTYQGHFHQFSWLTIGNEQFTNPVVGVFNEPSAFEDILIGEDYMSGRHFWVSYATSRLFVQTE